MATKMTLSIKLDPDVKKQLEEIANFDCNLVSTPIPPIK
jgi:predicted transcriptional regulator